MPKKFDKALRKIQIRVFEEDYNKLRSLFEHNIGINEAMRSILRTFIAHNEEEIRRKIDQMSKSREASSGPANIGSVPELKSVLENIEKEAES